MRFEADHLSKKYLESGPTRALARRGPTAVEQHIISEIAERLIDGFAASGREGITKQDVDEVIHRIGLRQKRPYISLLELFLTERCNLRCKYCFVDPPDRPRDMSFDVAREALKVFLRSRESSKDLHILFFGGEPLIMFDLMRYVVVTARGMEAEHGKKVTFGATTNGTLVNEDVLKFSKGKIKYLLSIDGDQEVHDKYRRTSGGRGSFDIVVEKLPLIKRYQSWIGTRMTVMPDTVEKLSYNVEYLYRLGVNQFIIGFATGVHWTEAAFEVYQSELQEVGRIYQAKKKRHGPFRITFFEVDCPKVVFGNKSTWGCRAGQSSATIDPDGNVFPCSRFLGDSALQEYCLGSIWQGGSWHSERWYRFLDNTVAKRSLCQKCENADYCTGGCPAMNALAHNGILKPDPYQCRLARIHREVLRNLLHTM